MKARPPWQNGAEIVAIYREARKQTDERGRQYHVDHIVPLVHPLVCGLDVSWNLQAMPPADNLRKGNRVWPDMP